ncbi:MAG: hypothetical protein CMM50_16995 [Rhodospirillaceae bacterium]|nr:hypothetical protein [Rhodospirillaceae bacterium]
MAYELYNRERAVIERGQQCLDGSMEDADLKAEFEALLSEYEKLFRTTQRLVRLSDRNEAQLNKLAGSLEQKNRELEEQQDALREARDEAEQAARAKAAFLATMSHEIRTPMNGVLGMLELLGLTALDSEQREMLAAVSRSSDAMLRIIDDILDFSKIEAGRLSIEAVPFDLMHLIEGVAALMRGRAVEKGLELEVAVGDGVPQYLRGDPTRLQQILLNFLSNAIKFTAEGRIGLSVEAPGCAGMLRFAVSDTGIGLSPEQQARLFQPFSQADASTTRQYGGTGLGLSIVKRLAELMGGEVGIDSALGRGAVFWIETPLPTLPPEEASAVAARLAGQGDDDAAQQFGDCRAPAAEEARVAGALILVAEDNATNRMVIERQLAKLGFAAEFGEDGEEAWSMLQRGGYGLLITDSHMPRLDGGGLIARIREAEQASGNGVRLPIIVFTADVREEERVRLTGLGADDCLSKPAKLGHLFAAVERLLPVAMTLRHPVDEAEAVASSGNAPTAAPPADAGAPLIDLDYLLDLFGDEEGVAEIIEVLSDSATSRFEELTDGLAQRDAEASRRAAHAMKGSARSAGAEPFASVCERIEHACAAGNLDEAAAVLDDAADLLRRTLAYGAEATGRGTP